MILEIITGAKATGACIVLVDPFFQLFFTSRRSFGLGSENRSISDCHPWEGVCNDIYIYMYLYYIHIHLELLVFVTFSCFICGPFIFSPCWVKG